MRLHGVRGCVFVIQFLLAWRLSHFMMYSFDDCVRRFVKDRQRLLREVVKNCENLLGTVSSFEAACSSGNDTVSETSLCKACGESGVMLRLVWNESPRSENWSPNCRPARSFSGLRKRKRSAFRSTIIWLGLWQSLANVRWMRILYVSIGPPSFVLICSQVLFSVYFPSEQTLARGWVCS